ncbi:MAG: VUT family protein, partial [bacterium]|nr:VUT family protein [bacterium]
KKWAISIDLIGSILSFGIAFRMNQSLSTQQSTGFVVLSISMITFLILLINVSFKIIIFHDLIYSVNSIICPIITGLYLLALRYCTFQEQRHLLNLSLITLYLFCIGIYILVNLPAAEYMHDNHVYQIIFEDIPKKFFATTLSFALSFYVPHLLFCHQDHDFSSAPKQNLFLTVLGGLSFFCMDFYFLFANPNAHSFKHIFIDSLMIAAILLLLMAVIYLAFYIGDKREQSKMITAAKVNTAFPIFHYLLCFALTIMLMCLACEYRLVAFNDTILAASCIFFPLTMIISTLFNELWGYKANIKLVIVLIAAQFIFDTSLMGLAALPSPDFFNLNPFYNYIRPRRLPAASLSLLVTFLSNALILHYLRYAKKHWQLRRSSRMFIANMTASSLLCLVDYSLLFGGIYSYDQIIHLVVNVWQYKLITTLLSLPLMLWLCTLWEKNIPLTLEPENTY